MNYQPQPVISIITISYNSEKTIEDTIKSVVTQNYPNLEYLIIDGGSKDKTLEIVEKYRDKISFVLSEPDKGISDAFNKGIKYATGDIIGIINSDDLLEPNALNFLAENYDVDIDVYSGNLVIWNDQNNKFYIQIPDISFKKLKVQYNVAHPARFISKKAYAKWGCYATDLRYKMDIDLLVRFAHAGASIVHIDRSLARFRIGGATSQSIWKKKNDFYLFIIRNGWSKFQFYYVWLVSVMKYCVKSLAEFFNSK